MAPRLPTTAAPGTATTTTVVRDGESIPPTDPRDTAAKPHVPKSHETRRVRGCERETVFVGYSRRPKQDESLMGPEISWCEYHCAGYWTVVYGHEKAGEGQAMYFGFSNSDDARAFEAWRQERRDSGTAPEDFE